MAFSQSFYLGENTLKQLDVFEVNVPSINKNKNVCNNKPTTPTNKIGRQQIPTTSSISNDLQNRSPICNGSQSNNVLDIIDESPTEKPNLLGKSIRERLKNASTSKKHDRKYMRRSRSDPIKSASESKRSHASSVHQSHGFTEDYGSMFESTVEWDMPEECPRKKTNIKLDEKFEDDDFDKYFGDIQTPGIQKNDDPNKTKNSSLIALSDSGEGEHVNVSEIDRLMRTENFGNDSSVREINEEMSVETNDIPIRETDPDQDEFEWEDSAFFNELIATQQKTNYVDVHQTEHNSPIEVAVDVEHISMHSGRVEAVEDELENCFLEVSMQLTDLNATDAKSIHKTGTQLDTSISFRSFKDNSIFSDSLRLTEESQRSQHNQQIQETQNSPDAAISLPNQLDIECLSQWSCSASIIKAYKKKGIHQMFEWQAECLSNPKIKAGNDNLLYSAPTSAGKTFVSEVLMFQTVLQRQKKVIIILPFISVVREKMYSLQDLLRSSGIRVEGFFGGYTAPGGFESADIAVCTIEKANAIINRLLEQNNIDAIGMVVVDEVHLISDSNRGYILELLLTKILYCSQRLNANIRIVAMSATLPNSQLVQNWLTAQFYLTDYRPIELREMIKIGNNIFDNTMNLVRMLSKEEYSAIGNDQDNIAQLCIETITNSAAVIVFCPSKDWCESLAIHVAQNIYKLGKSQTPIGEKIRKEINMPFIEEVKGHLRNSPAGLDSVLEKTISYGVAFHHAGLTFDERDIIESAFCKSSLRVIVATSTLSSGVNLPARRVIIRSPMFGGKPMCSLTYKQMIGRAGRMGKDTEGESILICANNNARVGQELIGATLKPITSCLSADNHTHLKRALLEIIASGVATTRTELEAFVKCTLYHSEHQFEIAYFDKIAEEYKSKTQKKKKPVLIDDESDENDSLDLIGKCMRYLEHYEFIRLQFDEDMQEIKFVSTRLGYACLASSMPPSDGFFLFSELQKARQNFVIETELHAIYLVTPFSVCYQLQDINWLFYLDMWEKLSNAMQRVGELVGVKESFLVKAMRGASNLDGRTLQIHKRFYTALVLHELINESPLNTVASKYKLTRGTLQSLQQTTSTFAGIVKSFCKALNWDLLALIVSQFQDRIFFGVHQDLVELMKISALNGQRARALFDAGYQNLVDISKANVLAIEKCLVDSISFDVQKRDGETNYDADQRNKQRLLFVTGKNGLTVKEAAQLIIDEARKYLCNEMGMDNIYWSQQQNSADDQEPEANGRESKANGREAIANGREAIANGREAIANGREAIAEEREASVNNRAAQVNDRNGAGSNPTVNVAQNATNAGVPANPHQKIQKRRISMDKESVTPNKRRNHGQVNQIENQLSGGSSSEDSDVDSIILDSSTSIYNDENDDFLKQLQPVNNGPVITNDENSSTPRLQIIDVTKTITEFDNFVKSFRNVKQCGFSLAIARLDVSDAERKYNCVISSEFYLYGLAFSYQDKYTAHFLNLQNDDNHIDLSKKTDFIRSILANVELTLQISDAKTQLKTLFLGVSEIHRIHCMIEDPQVAQWLIQPEDDRTFSKLITLYAAKCVDLSCKINDGRINAITTAKIRSSIKACITRNILEEQTLTLTKMGNGSIFKAFTEMEMKVQKSLLHMEQTGMALDRNALELLSEQISDYIGDLETEIFRMNGKRFAVNSSRSVAQALKIRKKNGTMAAKCTRAQLLQCTNPMAKLILEHRSLHAILTKSIQPLIRKTSENNRIYGSSFSFTQTGRISMHEPNLQNVAKDYQTEFKRQVFSCRSAFKVQSNRMLISADFCQLELRVLAHLSEDDGLINIFKTLNDVFVSIAAKWNKVAEADVTEKMRHDTKQICYGIIYGMGIKSLAITMKCDEEEAALLHESFHQTYPGIRNYTQKILNFVREKGYVETLAGRRRYIPDINANHNLRKRAQAERQAINTTIQGSAADIAKYAILRMERNLAKYQSVLKMDANHPTNGIQLVLHLHDELLYEVPCNNANQVIKILKSSMEKCAKLLVPLKVKLKKGQCWGNMQRIES